MSRPHPRRPRAFTLPEAIATMAVLGVLGSVSSTLIYTAITGYRDTAVQAQLHQEA